MFETVLGDILSLVLGTGTLAGLGWSGHRLRSWWRGDAPLLPFGTPLPVEGPRLVPLTPPALSLLEAKARILVVDDEDYAHYALLQRQFANLSRWTAIRGDAAKTIDDNFDLVILDVRGVLDDAGASDGLQALEVLRRYNPWVPVMLFTAYRGGIRGSRKESALRHAQAIEKKLIAYPEFSETVVRLLQMGFSRGYFEERLASFGMEKPAQSLAAIEVDPTAPSQADLKLEENSPFAQHQVNRVLDVARQIVRGERWTA